MAWSKLLSPLTVWSQSIPSDWERDAAGIVVKIQWFGLLVGFLLANVPGREPDSPHLLNMLLSVGLVYACVDSFYYFRGEVFFLSRFPLMVAFLETIFITLLCRYDVGLNSPYRFYYLLSLLVAAIRYPVIVPYLSCALHCISYTMLFFVIPGDQRDVPSVMLNIVVMGWVTWAASTLAWYLHRTSARLGEVNKQLQEQQGHLEERIQERTRELQDAQALLIHQEKMAAFGLLAAGIAHEVGNPLTSISSLVQLAQRRVQDPYVQERLGLVGGQLDRISGTLRELVNFSRPTTAEKVMTDLASVAQEALSIAKYYHSNRGKAVLLDVPSDLPQVLVARDQVTQALLNLVLNAIDATEKGGTIKVTGGQSPGEVWLAVADDGCGISSQATEKLFQPYYTTKSHGTGLGLFMTRRLVEQQGGTVSFTSAPGQGTTFRLHFPLKVVLMPTPPPPTPGPWMTGQSRKPSRLLVIDDEPLIRTSLAEFLEQEGFLVESAADGPAGLRLAAETPFDLVLTDIQMPAMDGVEVLERIQQHNPETFVILVTAYGTVETAVEAFKRGAQDYLLKPLRFDEVAAKVRQLLQYRQWKLENQWLRREMHRPAMQELIVGRGSAMQTVMSMLAKVARTRATVLILGESGTGKELIARELHQQGPDREERFLAINCAAIPNELLESQLFGHRKGAFTGAERDAEGLFQRAESGTLFLDEIGEMSLNTQAKILRAIEQKEFLPVGASEPVTVTTRIIAATNKDLAKCVEEGKFREDLYYRLNVVTLQLPPLRERREDIPELVDYLLAKQAKALGKRIAGVDHGAMRILQSAIWKGNIRELDNVLQRAVILSDGPLITQGDLPADLVLDPDVTLDEDLRAAMAHFEKRHLERILKLYPDKREAAKRLGLALSSLYRKIEESKVES